MKKFTLIILTLFLSVSSFFAQNSFKYQAVLRDNNGQIITNEPLNIRLSIIPGNESGSTVYSEEHALTVNETGIIHLNIGEGNATNGNFSSVNWGAEKHFIKIEVNRNNSGYITMGTSPLLSVPYAMHAQTVTNKDDADANPANEIQDLNLDGNTLTITNNDNATQIDLSKYNNIDTDKQELALDGTRLSISNGNIVDLAPIQDGTEDADADPTNEIQQISISNDTIFLSDGGKVKLPETASGFSGSYNDLSDKPVNIDEDSTDDFSGNYNDLENKPTLNGDVNGDITANTVSKIQGNAVSANAPINGQVLKWNGSAWTPATDIEGTSSNSEDGVVESVTVSGTSTKTITLNRSQELGSVETTFTDLTDDADNDASNELQNISLTNRNIELSNGGGIITIPHDDYNNLTNKPILSTVAETGSFSDLSNVPAKLDTDYSDDFSGNYNDLNNKPSLATVATSGNYDHLTNKPSIPTKVSELINDDGFISDYSESDPKWVVDSVKYYNINETDARLDTKQDNLTAGSNISISGGVISAAVGSYQGLWNAGTNTPTLTNGTGTTGEYYQVSVAGTWNTVSFAVGDEILYNGTQWLKKANVSTVNFNQIGGSPADNTALQSALNDKVTVEIGKGLSSEDFTSSDKAKLDNIESNAQANIKPDWNAVSGNDDEILNKPALSSVATSGNYTDLSNTPDLNFEIENYLTTNNYQKTDDDGDVNSSNEIQNLDFNAGTHILSISHGGTGSVNLSNYVDDADADPNNEIQNLTLTTDALSISNGNAVDLSAYKDNTDEQELNFDGTNLSISGGNSIDISALEDDADADPTNEIQDITLDTDNLSISDGSTVSLAAYKDNTDEQELSFDGTNLSISGGNSIDISALEDDADADPVNEIQDITLITDNLSISDGSTVSLAAYKDNTDEQDLQLTGSVLSIENGSTTVNLNNYVNDADADPTNEIQTIALNPTTNTLSLTKGGGSVILPTPGWGSGEALFAVVNSSNDTVFAVYEGGVRIYVDTTNTKAAKGGFAVASMSSSGKAGGNEILRVTKDSVRVYIDTSSTKAAKGGFAVASMSSSGKGAGNDFLRITNDSIRMYVNSDGSKAAKGGFAVASMSSSGKASSNELFRVTPDSVRVYIDTASTKAAKGGFAVASMSSSGKGAGNDFLRITNDSIRMYVNSDGSKAAKGGFAVASMSSSGKASSQEILRVTQDSVRIYIDTAATKAAKGGFAVASMSSSGKGTETEIMKVTKDSTRIYIADADAGFGVENTSSGTSERLMKLTEDNYFIGHGTGIKTKPAPEPVDPIGKFNTLIGYQSGLFNELGFKNTYLGYQSGLNNPYGEENVYIGNQAGMGAEGMGSADKTRFNVFVGSSAGFKVKSGAVDNVFIGHKAGEGDNDANTLPGITGSYNVFVGERAGRYITSGSNNVFLGTQAGFSNTEGSNNVFLGNLSGLENSIGTRNVFLGNESGFKNTEGESNVFIGYHAGHSNNDGNKNIFLGDSAGASNISGYQNIFIGNGSGSNISGLNILNIAIGVDAGKNLINSGSSTIIGNQSGMNSANIIGCTFLGAGTGKNTGSSVYANFNTFVGWRSGNQNTNGNNNTYLGTSSGETATGSHNVYIGSSSGINATGSHNTFIGSFSGKNATGVQNVFMGYNAGSSNIGGGGNVYIGIGSGQDGTTGANNVYLGFMAGENNEGSGNVFIGNQVGQTETSVTNKLYIDNTNTSNPLIEGDFSSDQLTINGKINTTGSVAVGTTQFSSLARAITIGATQIPVGFSSIANGVILYASGINAELRVRDEEGYTTTLSPHNFSLTEKSEPMAWSFYSENANTGQTINVDMLKAIRIIERMSNEKLVYISKTDNVYNTNLPSNEYQTNEQIEDNQNHLVEDQNKIIKNQEERIQNLEQELEELKRIVMELSK